MSGRRQHDDAAGTIRLDEDDLVEMQSETDLFAPFPDEARAQREDTVSRVPQQVVHEAPTRQARNWDLSPSPPHFEDDTPTNGRARAPHPQPQPPREEVTAVRAGGRASDEDQREWIDSHAVVDDEGRLRLPEDIARALQPGAIVEVRLAAWAVEEPST